MIPPLEPVSLTAIRAARDRLPREALNTPLLPLPLRDTSTEIYVKLENLQPIGSFKLRGAGNAMALADPARLSQGVYTASAGNMAQGVAWNARRLGVPCHVIVPEHAPETKLRAIAALGGEIVKVSFDEWWNVIVTHEFAGMSGLFIHPVSNPDVIAGNGTIGLEILEQLPDVDAIIVPYGGGGLSCGIACAVRDVGRDIRVYAAEVQTAAPLAASLATGKPSRIDRTPSFVDGIGGQSILVEMWPLAQRLLAGSLVVSLAEVASAIRMLLEHMRVVSEGAGAAAVAAAVCRQPEAHKIVCVVSGGNIDPHRLEAIIHGKIPS
jgi:threonine dehydratase